MKNILLSLILLTSTTISYAFGGVSHCSVYTYGHGSKDELSHFLQNLKQLTKQYECNNTLEQDDETEAMAICTKCNSNESTHFFYQIKTWITEQQNEVLQPCDENIDPQLVKEDLSKMISFPLRVISSKGRLKTISSVEEFYDLLPSILNNHVVQTIRKQSFEDMLCNHTGASMEDTIFIKRDDDQQLKIFLTKTPH